jgi:hypothetical protein
MTDDQLRALAFWILKGATMAKSDRLGGRLGKVVKAIEPPSIREVAHADRVAAFSATVEALRTLNKAERTNTLAAVAEFYRLSLTVDNGT